MAGEDPNASEAERQKREAEAKAAADAKAAEEKATADARAAEEKAVADAKAAQAKAAADAKAAAAFQRLRSTKPRLLPILRSRRSQRIQERIEAAWGLASPQTS